MKFNITKTIEASIGDKILIDFANNNGGNYYKKDIREAIVLDFHEWKGWVKVKDKNNNIEKLSMADIHKVLT